MENEAKNAGVTAEPGRGQAASLPAVPPPTSKIEFQKIAAEGTKFTFLVVFILYSMGFLTWQSYLSKYGVSVTGFLRAEYLSAALCYLFVLVTLAGPPTVLYQHWKHRKGGKPKMPRSTCSLAFGGCWFCGSRLCFSHIQREFRMRRRTG